MEQHVTPNLSQPTFMEHVPHLSFSTDNLKDWIDHKKDNVKGDDDDDYRRPSPYDRPHYGEGHYDSGARDDQSHFDD